MLTYLSSSSFLGLLLNKRQAEIGSRGFTRSNCSGSGGQGNFEELKPSRRNGTWPLCLAVRDSFWPPVKKSSFSAAQLQNLYHVVVPELHNGVQRWKHENRFFLTKSLQVTGQNFKWGLFFLITIQSVSIFKWIKHLV